MRIVRNARHAASALAVLLLAGTLAACGGGGGSGGSGGSEAADRAPAAKSATRGQEGGTGGAGGTAGPKAPLDAGREVVHTARLRVRARDVDAAATRAKRLAAEAGGYVERESSSTRPARSELVLKIPADRYGDLLGRLGTDLGAKLSLSQEAEDVTGEVADVEARVRSAKAALDSFRALLDRASSVTEIMRIESEIAEREADLEALQARAASLKHRTRYATVTVALVGEPAAAEKDDGGRGGFLGALDGGWNAFTAFVGGVAVVVGWLLPFLVAAAVIGLPVLAFRHRLRDRFGNGRATAAGEPGPEPEKTAVGAAAEGPAGPPPV